MPLVTSLHTILEPYRTRIDDAINAYISQHLPDDQLRQACIYSMGHSAKRLRPALVLIIAEALCSGYDAMLPALAIEFFHTASLIADDLPCMDDDTLRRGVLTLHRAFNEATALLSSYALIAEGYACFSSATRLLAQATVPHADNSLAIGLIVVENAAQNTGARGATGGQYLDLFIRQPDTLQIEEIVVKKTVSLFEIAFVSGWLYGGGMQAQLPLVKQAAYHLGMAFQIIDDFADYKHDVSQTAANVASACGISSAYEKLENALSAFEIALQQLGLVATPLTQIAQIMRIEARLSPQ